MRQIAIRLYLAVFVLAIGMSAHGEQFPALEFENLRGQKVTMPAAAAGAPALFIIGFTHGSSEQTNYWAKHVTADIVKMYSVAVLQDAPRLVRGMALHGVKSGVPKDKQERFLVLYNNEEELKAAAGFQSPEEAYLILIGPDGSIRWRFHGPFTHTALKELRDRIRQ